MRDSIWLLALFLVGCGGEQTDVEVRLTQPTSCTLGREILSVRTGVLRVATSLVERIEGIGKCLDLEPPAGTAAEVFDALSDSAALLAGAPAEDRTSLQLVGYGVPGCAENTAVMCGATCPPIQTGDVPEDGVALNFWCDTPVMRACLNPQLAEDPDQVNAALYSCGN